MQSSGPQASCEHIEVVDAGPGIEEHRPAMDRRMDFKEFLLSIPKGEGGELEFERSKELPRTIDLSD